MSEPVLEVELPTRRATIHLARDLSAELGSGDLVILSGQLGAGKTFFVRAVARARGLRESERVTSPTFSLIQELPLEPPVAHADLYRLSTGPAVAQLGLDEMRDLGHLLLVEWGEYFVAELGGDAVILKLCSHPRKAVFSCTGPRSDAICRALQARLARLP